MKEPSKKTGLGKGLLVGIGLIFLILGGNSIKTAYGMRVPQSPTPTKSSAPSVKPTTTPVPTPIKSRVPESTPSAPTNNYPNRNKKYLTPLLERKQILTAIEETGKVEVYGINFDFDRAEIRPDSIPTIDEIAAVLKQNPDLKIYVVGHTDIIGDFHYNLMLSQARAEAVVEVLINQYEIDPTRLAAHGVGQLVPIANNDSEAGRAKNRRVELVKQPN